MHLAVALRCFAKFRIGTCPTMVDPSLIVDMVLGSLRAILLFLAGWPVILRTSDDGRRGPVDGEIGTYDAGSESADKACLGRILRSLRGTYTLYKYLIR